MAPVIDMKEEASADQASRSRWSAASLLGAGVLAYLWFVLARQLSVEWSVSPQYAYGWFVPPLCVLLAWKRWRIRPAPEPPRHTRWAIGVATFCALLIPPVRLLFEVAAELRMLDWLLAASVVGITLCGIYLMGGRAWLLHFAFPIIFILVAVPWLMGLEEPLIQFLTRVVTKLTVACLNIFGMPASRSGNVIETMNGPVGVDQACSGVRSFQGMLMIALFLGELIRLQWQRRIALLGLGVVIAFLLNIARAFFLSWNAVRFGLNSIAKLHDNAGFVIFWVSFLMVWGLAELMRPVDKPAALPSPSHPGFSFRLSTAFVIGLACFLALTQAGIEWWYRLPERHGELNWTVKLPPPGAWDFQEGDLSESVRQKLQHDRQTTGSWTDFDGSKWNLFFFRWERGPIYSRIMARFHRPEACFPAGGSALIADHGMRVIHCGDVDLSFRAYEFDWKGQLLRVYYCTADDQVRAAPLDGSREWETALDTKIGEASRMRKILSVWRGGRKMAQQTLEIFVSGYATQEEADAAMRRTLPQIVQSSPQ